MWFGYGISQASLLLFKVSLKMDAPWNLYRSVMFFIAYFQFNERKLCLLLHYLVGSIVVIIMIVGEMKILKG